MKTVAIFLSVLNAVLSLEPIRFPVREISNDSVWSNVESRIYGGTEASEGRFPFMVFTMMKTLYGISQCSASLIKPDLVLLAAHCVIFPDLRPEDVILVGGKANVKDYVRYRVNDYYGNINENSFGLQERRAKKFLIHPKYNDRTLEHDVAFVVLERPFNLNPVKTISLSKDDMKTQKECTILGWGLNLGNVQTFKLNFVQNKKVRTTKMGCLVKANGPFICLEPDHRYGICQGDSGSPLVCDDQVWGVASHFVSRSSDPDCGDSIEEYYTQLYTDLDWILPIVNGGFKSVVMNPTVFLFSFFLLLLCRL